MYQPIHQFLGCSISY